MATTALVCAGIGLACLAFSVVFTVIAGSSPRWIWYAQISTTVVLAFLIPLVYRKRRQLIVQLQELDKTPQLDKTAYQGGEARVQPRRRPSALRG
jgi:hypothetical protein